jgi:hypothetical protein
MRRRNLWYFNLLLPNQSPPLSGRLVILHQCDEISDSDGSPSYLRFKLSINDRMNYDNIGNLIYCLEHGIEHEKSVLKQQKSIVERRFHK